jgi:hypothetical protein
LEHYLKLGNKRKHVDKLQKLQDSGVRVKSLENDVPIHPAGEWLWRVWEELAAKRLWTEAGPVPIQTSEINAYAQYHDIPQGVLREDLYYIVSSLDMTYVAHIREQQERDRRKQAIKSKSKAGRAPRRGRRGR